MTKSFEDLEGKTNWRAQTAGRFSTLEYIKSVMA